MTYGLRQRLENIFYKEPHSIYLGFVVHVVSEGTTQLLPVLHERPI